MTREEILALEAGPEREAMMRAAVEAMTGKTLMCAWAGMAEVLAMVCPDATDEELEALDAAMWRSFRGEPPE